MTYGERNSCACRCPDVSLLGCPLSGPPYPPPPSLLSHCLWQQRLLWAWESVSTVGGNSIQHSSQTRFVCSALPGVSGHKTGAPGQPQWPPSAPRAGSVLGHGEVTRLLQEILSEEGMCCCRLTGQTVSGPCLTRSFWLQAGGFTGRCQPSLAPTHFGSGVRVTERAGMG